MAIDVEKLAGQIISQASATASSTWTKISASAPHFIRAYAQALASIATGLAIGELTKAQAKSFEKTARLLLVQGIANTAQIVMAETQQFIQGVLNALQSTINSALPIALL